MEQLEFELEQLRHSGSTSRKSEQSRIMIEREQAFRSRGDVLEQENTKLRAIKAQLEERLGQEQARREKLDIREKMRQNLDKKNSDAPGSGSEEP